MKQIQVDNELNQIIVTIDNIEVLRLSVGESYGLAHRLMEVATKLEEQYVSWLENRRIITG